jgi:hypothetical protein
MTVDTADVDRLIEAIAWSERRASGEDVSGCLRTASLRPAVLCRSIRESVSSVNSRRRRLLKDADRPAVRGRIIAFWPQQVIADGISEAASSGFFDADDCPPWDTLFASVQEASLTVVLAYVPKILLAHADAGIHANMLKSIQWVSTENATSLGCEPLLQIL